jgi:hypothetical protein
MVEVIDPLGMGDAAVGAAVVRLHLMFASQRAKRALFKQSSGAARRSISRNGLGDASPPSQPVPARSHPMPGERGRSCR